jgi:surfactin synthase thioesterase subunit
MTEESGCFALPINHVVECFREETLRARQQIWCFPHAGAGAAEFASWARMAGPDYLVCAVRLPGRERRLGDEPFADIGDLSVTLAEDIRSLIDPHAVFYGQCFGAIAAFETVAQLERLNATVPARLFVASQLAPSSFDDEAPRRLASLDGAAFLQAVKDLGGWPPDLEESDEMWALLEPALRADFQMMEEYAGTCPPKRISVPITALVGSDDHEISLDGLEGWAAHTTAKFNVQVLPGEHLLSRSSTGEIMEFIKCASPASRRRSPIR